MNLSLESLKENYVSDKLSFFSNILSSVKTVFYPCCGFDKTPSYFFDNVIYFDKNIKACEFLKEHNLNVSCLDVTNFRNKECDLLLLFNHSVSLDLLLKSFSPSYVLCNNLHNTADDLMNNNQFVLLNSYLDVYLFRKI